MIFQNVLCIGDSQTSGARIRIGYPEALASVMEERTGVAWNCINAGVPKETLIEILRRTQRLVREFSDVFIVCLLAGCNDTRVDHRTPPKVFALLYRQLINALQSAGVTSIFVGLIPVIHIGFGHLPYDQNSRALRMEYNVAIRHLATEFKIPLVDTTMDRAMYIDSVHLNEAGCFELASRFADVILHSADGAASDLLGLKHETNADGESAGADSALIPKPPLGRTPRLVE